MVFLAFYLPGVVASCCTWTFTVLCTLRLSKKTQILVYILGPQDMGNPISSRPVVCVREKRRKVHNET